MRQFASSAWAANKAAGRAEAHREYLAKFYNPELLQSIAITESLVTPKQYVLLRRLRLAPADGNTDFSSTDPKWDEPITVPNQAAQHTPYPAIPQIEGADRTDLKLRFVEEAADGKARPQARGPPLREMYERLHRLTGLDVKYMQRLYVRPVVMRRVSCQTSKGKIPNFYALTVVGDKNGMLGIGEGKSREGMRTALAKAHWLAIKALQPIPRYENRTIIGDIDFKFHAVKLFMKLAPAGLGLRVNPNIFEVCQAAGIKDLRGKVYKLRNPMNVVKGFVKALTQQTSLADLAAGRGKRLIDLRKVYYSA